MTHRLPIAAARKGLASSEWVHAIRLTIAQIPRGKVSTYGAVAAAAGYPGYHRQVAQILSRAPGGLPWHRVLGAQGSIRTCSETGMDQRIRLELEGVSFRGKRVVMEACEHHF